ncbi:MAG: hypothetical protein JWM78_2862 [Verrucomicrobiaceae bacterium]|nr:hypothetical protein [Verrucomicrobiaceae bacterium]
MHSRVRRLALLLLMLTLPLYGWALAAAPACMNASNVSSQLSLSQNAPAQKHACCTEQKQKTCAEHQTVKTDSTVKTNSHVKTMDCSSGSCHCGGAVSMSSQPFVASAIAASITVNNERPFYPAPAEYSPPYRPPINS